MLAVLVLSLASLARTSPILGSAQCSWGPSYWCATIPQASECGAMKHCIKAVWEKEEVPQDDDEVCRICKDMVTQARDTLISNETQEELKEVFDGSCNLIPISLVAKECRALMDEFVPELVETLASEMNPDTVCTVSGLCNSARIDRLLEEQEETVKEEVGDNTCVLCEYVVTTLDGMVTDKTNEKEIKDALEAMCSYMPSSITKQCDNFVETYTEMIIDMLTKDVTPEMICDNLGLCKKNMFRPVEIVEVETVRLGGPRVGGPYCSLCDIVISNLDSQLQDKTNEEEIKNALDVLCYELSTPVHKECIKLVSQYTDELVDMIVKNYPPNVICAELGLCVDHEISSNDISQVNFETLEVRGEVRDEVGCEICEFAVSVIDERLGDEATVDQIEREVQFVCSILPGHIAEKCEDLVDQYGERLIDALIKKDLDPKKVCTEIVPACKPKQSACVWGPDMWCASPFHARICRATSMCQKVWDSQDN
jgi:saposin